METSNFRSTMLPSMLPSPPTLLQAGMETFTLTASAAGLVMLITWGDVVRIWAPLEERLSESENPGITAWVRVPPVIDTAIPLKLKLPSGFWTGTSFRQTSFSP